MMTLIQDHLFTMLGTLLGVVVVVHMLRREMRPAVSIAWLLAIVLMPYVGVPMYILLGNRKWRKMTEQKSFLSSSLSTLCVLDPPLASRAASILDTGEMPPARGNTTMRFLDDGQDAYETVCAMIRSAERSISIMIFILGRDDVGRSIVSLLSERAREGIEVRLLMDGLGCLWTRGKFVDELREAGGQVATFLPMLPVQRKWSANLRNHRKVIIVDGVHAVVGGMNLGDEYMGPESLKTQWVDTVMEVQGATVLDLKQLFISDWNFVTDEGLEASALSKESAFEVDGTGIAQVVSSGPDVKEEPMYDAILSSIYEARQRIWIVSPYFVPDDVLIRALSVQARLGLDVRIILPQRSNHFFADLARGRSIRTLAEAGASIQLYEGRMMHAKHLVFDDSLAVSGSMNFDMRSLYFNYEVAVFVYSRGDIDVISQWISKMGDQTHEWTESPRGSMRRLAEDFSALVSPLL